MTHTQGNSWPEPEKPPSAQGPLGHNPPQGPGHAVAPYHRPATLQPSFDRPGYDPHQQPVYVMPLKSAGIAYLLWLFLGGFGAHHFYAGKSGTGATLLTLWVLGIATSWLGIGVILMAACLIWLFVDLFLIPGYIRDANARMLGWRSF